MSVKLMGIVAVGVALAGVILTSLKGTETRLREDMQLVDIPADAYWTITTFAGRPAFVDRGPAVEAELYNPAGVAVDSAGNLYIADSSNNGIRKVDSTGTITTIAGTGELGFSGDGGPAVEAELYGPAGVAVDSAGNLYIADSGNQRIRKVDSTGTITTIAGTGEFGFSGDGGPAVEAELYGPAGVAVDSAGNLYIADSGNRRIRKIDSTGTITTIAGTGEFGFSGDGGPAVEAEFRNPYGVAVDSAGNVYIADTGNRRIRKIDSTGTITTIAGPGEFGFSGDGGPAVEAELRNPYGVAVDSAGNVYIADSRDHRIRKVDSTGTITTIAGTGEFGFSGDGGPAVEAELRNLYGVAVDSAGNVYIADTDNHRIRKVDSTGTITTIAGTGEFGFSGDGGPAVEAEFRRPHGVAVDSAGNLYIADIRNRRIRKIDSTGTITTIAGTGEFGFSGDGGPAAAARLTFPYGVAVDSAGNLYIADTGNRRIRKIDSTGTITTIAGTGEFGFSGDGGPAVEAELRNPYGVAVDSAGNVYIADPRNRRIRKVDSTGTITTIAGTGEFGFGGDGGPAAAARLTFPYGVAVDSAGNLYIADAGNRRIRKIDSTGTITTIAGTGEFGFSGDGGPAVEAELRSPRGVAVDSVGNVYIADASNNGIRKVDSTGTITTIAGTGEFGFSGDGGPAAVARLAFPYGVAVDSAGNLYIADTLNRRIRKLTPGGGSTPPNPTAVLNAASFTPGAAPGSLQSLFGERLALETAAASELPLPEALGGVRIEIIDSTEAAHAVQLLYVSPGQINFLTPSEATPGAAVLRLTREGEEPVESALTISVAAPGLFSANGTGEGIGAITALRVAADGSRSTPAVFRFEAGGGRVVGVPLDLGDEGDRVFLTLFGTGIRGAGGATGVQAMISDREVPVLFAGAQSGFAGLDQVNIGPLPRSLAGAGEINVVVTAAGTTSNTVTIVME